MKLIFFLLVLLGSGGGIYALLASSNQKISALRMDLMLSKQQLVQLQNKYKAINTERPNFNIEFLTPEYNFGILPKNTPLYLYPEKNSPLLQKTPYSIQVTILDCAVTNSSKWYYVSLSIDTNINCNGWVNLDNFSNLETHSQTPPKTDDDYSEINETTSEKDVNSIKVNKDNIEDN